MITCTQFEGLLGEWFDDELRGARRKDLEAHLTGCPPCMAILNNVAQAKEMATEAYDHPWDLLPELTDEQVRTLVAAMRRSAPDETSSSSAGLVA